MAVVNICRPAWKGPRVTRRTISLFSSPPSLSFSVRSDHSSFSWFARCHWTNFWGISASPFLFLFLSRARTSAAGIINYPGTKIENAQFLVERRQIRNDGRGSINAKRTGQQHWEMARVTRVTFTTRIRSSFFLSFARGRPRVVRKMSPFPVRDSCPSSRCTKSTDVDEDASTFSGFDSFTRYLKRDSISRVCLRREIGR